MTTYTLRGSLPVGAVIQITVPVSSTIGFKKRIPIMKYSGSVYNPMPY